MEDPQELDKTLLLDLIKEDRNEIRIIKNRIYTYMQALIVASFAITAFIIKDGGTDWPKDQMIIGVNGVFLVLSWVLVGFQYADLYFVRKCLTWRECLLSQCGVDYFGKRKKCSHVFSEKCQNASKLPCSGLFNNDLLLFLPMFLLTLVYAGIIYWAHTTL